MLQNFLIVALLIANVTGKGLRNTNDMSIPRKLTPMEQVAEMTGSDPFGCYVENNFDYVGNDLKNVPGAVGDCCAACRNTKGCVAYTWSDHSGGTCWLKNYVDEIVVNTNTKSAVIQYYYQSWCPDMQEGLDYPGNDIGSAHAEEAWQCCELCRNYTGCRAYTHTSYLGGTCWFKSKRGSEVANPEAKSGLAYRQLDPGLTECEPIQENLDFEGGDVLNVPGDRPEACCNQCRSHGDCLLYTWSDHNGGTCWLKNWMVKPVAKQGVYSGRGWGPQCIAEMYTDFVGNDIGNKPAAIDNDCCEICARFEGCKYYTWTRHNGGTCWLKSSKSGSVQNPAATSGSLV